MVFGYTDMVLSYTDDDMVLLEEVPILQERHGTIC